MWFSDSLKSLISGLGTSKDKSAAMAHVLRQIEPDELNAMHRSDWLARKVVDIIPNDMTREWRDWQAEGDQIEAIEAVEKSPLINVAAKVNLALQVARLFGGSVVYIGIRGDDPTKPLEIDRIGKGALQYLHVLSSYEVSAGEVDHDVGSEFYGEPTYYEVSGAHGAPLRVHPSRMIRFVGAPILDRRSATSTAWGDSILQVVYDAVTNAASAQQHIAALLPEAKLDVITIPGLGEATKTEAGRNALISRFTFANTAKSMLNAVLIDGNGKAGDGQAGEKWEQKQISFAQMPELMQQFLKIAAGAADITLIRLLQDAPSGLGANGDTALQSYYDNIAARQRTELSPAMHRLDEVIIRSALGSRPPTIYYEWSPLWGMTEKEKAEVFKMKADAARAIAGTGGASPALMPIEALSDALVNTLVEDGSLPGLQDAISEYGSLSEQEDEGEDESAALTPPAPPLAANDAAPRTLYVQRKLLNADEFIAWAKAQGFDTTTPAADLHVTVAFSRVAVDWMKAGESWNNTSDGKLTVPPGGARLVEKLGDKGAVVLLFNSSELSWRHEAIRREAGASWDHPEFQPHVTITYAGGDLDLSKVEPYRGKLVFGPEIFEEINDNWTARLKET